MIVVYFSILTHPDIKGGHVARVKDRISSAQKSDIGETCSMRSIVYVVDLRIITYTLTSSNCQSQRSVLNSVEVCRLTCTQPVENKKTRCRDCIRQIHTLD
jgi:hypothetical protein